VTLSTCFFSSIQQVVIAAAGLLCISSAFSQGSHLSAPTDLRTAGMSEPLAVTEAKPEFSWRDTEAAPSLHGVKQAGYQMRIAASSRDLAAEKALLWDSGKVAGDATLVHADSNSGQGFESQHEYVWQVRVWDENDHASAWSKPARWTQAPTWRARWIAADSTDAAAGSKPMPLLRKEFSVTGPFVRALLYVSGLGQYELRVNGSKAGNSELTPGWSNYRKTIFYDTYDVTPMLRPGSNAIGVMLGNGMYRVLDTPGRYKKFVGSFGPPQCIAQLHLELANGKSIDVVSDETWKTHAGPITFSSTYGGEDYDARREMNGWDHAGFDDSNWSPVVETDGPGGALRPDLAPPIRIMHTYTPIRRTEPKPGVLVYDLGQNFAGWPAITVSGPAAATVKLIPGELLNADRTVSQRSSGEPQWFAYTLKGGAAEQWHPRFSYYGFRYVQVEGAADGTHPQPGKPQLTALRGEAVHTSSEAIGSFTSSDDLLNRIHLLIVRAIENNAVSLFTDCPHREKLGWLEEAHLLAPSMLYDFDFSGLYAATARNIADTQKQDEPNAGRVPEIAPQYVVFGVDGGIFDDSPEWGSTAVLAPWYVYERDGNLPALLSHIEVMRRYVDYLSTRADHNIVAYGLGDWYDIGPGEPGVSKLTTSGVTATAIYYQDLRVLEKTLALAGRDDESQAYAQKADAVRKDFNVRFFDAANHRYDKGSQTAQAMPLVVGLAPEDERENVLKALVDDIRAHENHVTAGDVGFHYVVDALLDGGRSDVLYDMLERTDTPSYGYQLAQGATALTEAWDANPSSSQDHFMLGHAEEWFYRGLGGINVDLSAKEPRQLVLRPQLAGKLTSVETRYVSALGPVESNWKRGPAQTEYTFTIPANAAATVQLMSSSPAALRIDGTAPDKAAGVISARVKSDRIELVLGSGHYHISAPNPEGRR
jgi:hypothetical protein